MIKILYIISTLSDTGPVNIIYETIKNIDRTKFEPIILTLSPETKNSAKNKFFEIADIHSLNLSRKEGYLKWKLFKEKVRQINPDIIHSHCFRSILFSGIYLKEYKSVSTIHNDYTQDYVMNYGKFIGNIMVKLQTFALKNIDINCSVSEKLSEILKQKIRGINFNYVNNGIDIEKFVPADDKKKLREELGLPLNKKIFIYVGALSERKNPKLLINAFKNIENKDIYLILRGDGLLKEECVKLIDNYDNIRILNRVNNLDMYYKACDFYISASNSEGLPGAVIEGIACGLPVVLSNIEQHKYVLSSNAGKLFNVNDGIDLKIAVNDILNENYYELSKRARELALSRFSSKIMTKNYEYKYMELLNNENY